MRLVDADRLYDQVEAQYRRSSGEEHRTERLLLDAICDSPTIDAIPVEWLKKKLEQKKQQRYGQLGVASITKVLMYWQKEQGACDA